MNRMAKLCRPHLPVEYAGEIMGVVSLRHLQSLRIEKLNKLMRDINAEAARRF